jgi:hypothetical protein
LRAPSPLAAAACSFPIGGYSSLPLLSPAFSRRQRGAVPSTCGRARVVESRRLEVRWGLRGRVLTFPVSPPGMKVTDASDASRPGSSTPLRCFSLESSTGGGLSSIPMRIVYTICLLQQQPTWIQQTCITHILFYFSSIDFLHNNYLS